MLARIAMRCAVGNRQMLAGALVASENHPHKHSRIVAALAPRIRGRYERGMVGCNKFVSGCGLVLAVWGIVLVDFSPAAAQTIEPLAAVPQTCTKAEFEAVVDDAAEALRNLNQKKKPDFQDLLRQLKDKRGWTHDEFLKAAAPFVKDDQIDVYDNTSNALLEKISEMGQDGTGTKQQNAKPDCAVLIGLHEQMKVLVQTQNTKWDYMFSKLNAELQK